jgi:hypothetical protein
MGCSWGNAYVSLQDALAVAGSGDEIWVATGTYYPDEGMRQVNNDRNSTFRISDGVSVYGGFLGQKQLGVNGMPTITANVTF